MSKTNLMLLWHMHQPYYKDLAENVYTMPWVRLHALKDYYGMVAMLREFPAVHVTFNLVPSLLLQLEDYARDQASEPAYEIAFKPVAHLTAVERESLVDSAFQVNRERLLSRYPRFQQLYEKATGGGAQHAARLLSNQELLDLQVLSQLAWFDEIYLAGDPGIQALVAREREYVEEDKSLLRMKECEIFNEILKEYNAAAVRGQIEISTSPFYHPILPLVCDTDIANEAHPGVTLPRDRFRHPEDARTQLETAVQLHQRLFGRRPPGLWPSEGSVSDEVLGLAAELGFKWTATDEGVLGRSLGISFDRLGDGTVRGGQELYRPHRHATGGHEISLFFRDHQLSDLIGFVYSHMDAEAAAADLHQRIRNAGRSTGDRPSVISVILDGENAWESYEGNGREFLKKFYARLSSDPELRALTASEALSVTEPGNLGHIVPGSWINANFDIWIGADEDNRAWELLSSARDFFAENYGKPGVAQEQAELARQELYIAEGSDWCWWYGPEHWSAFDEEFDLLYRKHLSNIYRMLGGSPPDDLAASIKRPKLGARYVPPSGTIDPIVDGRITSYFEWLGAGVYAPDGRSGSMHSGTQYIEALYYGCSREAFFIRLDPSAPLAGASSEFEVRLNLDGESPAHFSALVHREGLGRIQFFKGDAELQFEPGLGEMSQAAFASILEMRLDYSLLNLKPRQKVSFQVSLWVNGLPVQIIPQEGWLVLELTDDTGASAW